MRICGFEVDEVLELLDRSRLHCKESKAWQQLGNAPMVCLSCVVTHTADSAPRSSQRQEESDRKYQDTCAHRLGLRSQSLRSYEGVSSNGYSSLCTRSVRGAQLPGRQRRSSSGRHGINCNRGHATCEGSMTKRSVQARRGKSGFY